MFKESPPPTTATKKQNNPPREAWVAPLDVCFFSNFSLPPPSRCLTGTEALRKGIREPGHLPPLRLREDERFNRKWAPLPTSPRIPTGTFSRMEEPKPMPGLGLALSKITKPKCNQYSSKLDSLLKTQAPLQGRGQGQGGGQTPGSPDVPLGNGYGRACLREN